MENDLMLSDDLMNLLGFKDMRSITVWCHKNSVPLVKIGKRKYVSRSSVNAHINSLLKQHVGREVPAKIQYEHKQVKQGGNSTANSQAAIAYMKKFKSP